MAAIEARAMSEEPLTWEHVDAAYKPTATMCALVGGSGIVFGIVLAVLLSVGISFVTFTDPALLWALPLLGIPSVVAGYFLGRRIRSHGSAGASTWPGKPADERLAVLQNAAVNEVGLASTAFVLGFVGSMLLGNMGPYLLGALIGGSGVAWLFPRKSAWGKAVGAGDISTVVLEE